MYNTIAFIVAVVFIVEILAINALYGWQDLYTTHAIQTYILFLAIFLLLLTVLCFLPSKKAWRTVGWVLLAAHIGLIFLFII